MVDLLRLRPRPRPLQDERFSWYLPDSLLRSQRTTLPQSISEMPGSSSLQNRRYAANGLLLSNSYDTRRAAGYTLSKSLEHYIAKARRRHLGRGHRSTSKPRSQVYFEKTLRLLNDHGITLVIVLMPVHPTALRALSDSGLRRSHRHLVGYLKSLTRTYRLRVVDLSRISSFDGDSSGFYDGVHMTRANSDKAMKAVFRAAADELK